jgi:hypothetical protein
MVSNADSMQQQPWVQKMVSNPDSMQQQPWVQKMVSNPDSMQQQPWVQNMVSNPDSMQQQPLVQNMWFRWLLLCTVRVGGGNELANHETGTPQLTNNLANYNLKIIKVLKE